ncbi:hypothetical protein BV22DRAFT_1132942 [Leucogyrophana mollusca]|uniref:Uncharacterized protein n=1 Tax=Leucogyrophana mollusca TaxID=85980 RepID=A0ACB8B4G2_9AGAM|nr:hypothetical protein BV22DRAFT_1132942 [Leucogyrophana mollusca]
MAQANPFVVSTHGTSMLVLCYGNDRVCIKSPETFAELEEVAQQEFSLPAGQKLTFTSSNIDVSLGEPTRIRESVWHEIRLRVRKIAVSVTAGLVPVPPAVADNQIAQDIPRVHVPPPDDPAPEDQLHPAAEPPDEPEENLATEDPADDLHEPEPEPDAQGEASGNENAGASELEANITRNDDDDEDPQPDAPLVKSAAKHRASITSNHSQVPDREPTPPPQASFLRNRDAGQEEAAPDPVASPPRVPSAKVKREPGNRAAAQGNKAQHEEIPDASQSEPANVQPVSEKLLINIAHRASKQQAMFHVRPNSRVSKVVAGACKSFRLDYDSAQLFLIVTMEEDGEEMEHLFECDIGDTMSRVGAEEGSKFIIKMVGDM